MSVSSTCLYTKIKNISSQPFYISCLGNHGVLLQPGADTTIFGTIFDLLRQVNRNNTRKINSLIAALENGLIAIISSPSPVFYDATLDDSKMIQVDNGAVSPVNPCYGSYSGSP